MTTASSPTPTIRQLSDDIANAIAAGEVIERPAAVVKELVENSLDAGATRITVRISDGGQRLIEVTDNGHGMQTADVPLAISRHATSKLTCTDDLFRIGTLGFRGEALPSISGVSEFELASRPANAEAGCCLTMRGNETINTATCAMPQGTRVTVRNLFWNVPARLKFLKAASTEAGHVSDQIMRLALGHPQVAFTLISNDRTSFEVPDAVCLEDRIRACFSKDVSDGLLPVVRTHDAVQLTGFVAHPDHARPTTKRQFVFLNGRYIHDKLIIAAIREGYKGFLEPRLHGSVFLHLDIDPGLIDINVHPTKSEVRFRNSSEIFGMIRNGIQETLSEHAGGFELFSAPAAGAHPNKQTVSSFDNPIVSRTVIKAPQEPAIQERYLPQGPQSTAEPVRFVAEQPVYAPRSEPHTAPAEPVHNPRPQQDDGVDLSFIKNITQLHNMYLLIETDSGVRIVDQHALHEKAIFLSLDPSRSDFEGNGRQELLIPQNVDLSVAEMAVVEPLLEKIKTYGIEAEVFGPTTLLVRAHPIALAKTNWTSFFMELANAGNEVKSIEKLRERIAHSASCKSAVKAGDTLNQAECYELARLLYTMEHMEHCPHGRPTTLDLSWPELERRFQR